MEKYFESPEIAGLREQVARLSADSRTLIAEANRMTAELCHTCQKSREIRDSLDLPPETSGRVEAETVAAVLQLVLPMLNGAGRTAFLWERADLPLIEDVLAPTLVQ